MADAALQTAGRMMAKKVIGKQMADSVRGRNDPYYDYYKDPRTGKVRREKKRIPAWIPEHDAKILHDVRKRAHRLDEAFNLLGFRVGISAVVGLIPGAGDVFDTVAAYSVYRKCKKISCGLDGKTDSAMMAWVVADCLIGLVPILGDLIDAGIKPNTHNLKLLMKRLDEVYMPEEERARLGLPPKKPQKQQQQRRQGSRDNRPHPNDRHHDSRHQNYPDHPPPEYEEPEDDYDHAEHDPRRRPENRLIEDGQTRQRPSHRNGSKQRNPEMSQTNPVLPARPANDVRQQSGGSSRFFRRN